MKHLKWAFLTKDRPLLPYPAILFSSNSYNLYKQKDGNNNITYIISGTCNQKNKYESDYLIIALFYLLLVMYIFKNVTKILKNLFLAFLSVFNASG